MNEHKETKRFDSHALGLAFKDARERKGWTQDYLAERVGKTSRTIMGIENKGQHPSFDLLYQLATLLDVSIDRHFFTDIKSRDSLKRKYIDFLLDSMTEQELTIIEGTAEGIHHARETEVRK